MYPPVRVLTCLRGRLGAPIVFGSITEVIGILCYQSGREGFYNPDQNRETF